MVLGLIGVPASEEPRGCSKACFMLSSQGPTCALTGGPPFRKVLKNSNPRCAPTEKSNPLTPRPRRSENSNPLTSGGEQDQVILRSTLGNALPQARKQTPKTRGVVSWRSRQNSNPPTPKVVVHRKLDPARARRGKLKHSDAHVCSSPRRTKNSNTPTPAG